MLILSTNQLRSIFDSYRRWSISSWNSPRSIFFFYENRIRSTYDLVAFFIKNQFQRIVNLNQFQTMIWLKSSLVDFSFFNSHFLKSISTDILTEIELDLLSDSNRLQWFSIQIEFDRFFFFHLLVFFDQNKLQSIFNWIRSFFFIF